MVRIAPVESSRKVAAREIDLEHINHISKGVNETLL